MGEIERIIALARERLLKLPRRVIIESNPGSLSDQAVRFMRRHESARKTPHIKSGDIIFNGVKIGEVPPDDPEFSKKVSEMIGKSVRESRGKHWNANLPLGNPCPPHRGFASGGLVRGSIMRDDEFSAILHRRPTMAYDYRALRSYIFTDEGQRKFLKVRDNAKAMLAKSGAATMEKLVAGMTGDSWEHMACVDRMVELNELREIPNLLSGAGQHRLFIAPL